MNRFAGALDLRLRASHRLLRFIVLVHAAAALVVGLAGWRMPWLWALLAVLALSLVGTLRRYSGAARVIRLQRRPDGGWRWERADGRVGTATAAGSTVSTPHIVLLHLRAANRRRRLAIPVLPDSVDSDGFRALRVVLRLYG